MEPEFKTSGKAEILTQNFDNSSVINDSNNF